MNAAEFVEVDGRKTRYRAGGTGTPMLLIHGISRSLEDWDEVFDTLVADHTVYAIDLAGYGHSDPVKHATLPALAQAAIEFLDAMGVTEPVVIAGNSLGGAVAQQVAVFAPERVAALILVDSAGFGKEVTPALRILALPLIGRIALRPSRQRATLAIAGILYDKKYRTEERITHAYALSQRPGGATVMLQTAKSMGNWRGIRPEWREELLAKVAALHLPVLLVWGEKDNILPAHHLEAARAAYPHAHVHLFPGTGHMPQIERADEFTALVEAFLGEAIS